MKVSAGDAVGTAATAATCVIFFMMLAVANTEESPQSLDLSQDLMKITNEAVKLSKISYWQYDVQNELLDHSERNTISVTGDRGDAFVTTLQHPDFADYDFVNFYTQEPDQAIVAKKEGRCYVAFRGTKVTIADWLQNLDPRDRLVYRNNDTSTGESCEVRRGYVEFLDSDAVNKAFEDLMECVEPLTCDDASYPCLILTGHSQGGASATILSILLHGLNPNVITFGQPPSVGGGCDSIPSRHFYRYVNAIKETDSFDLAFDPVAFVPTFISKSVHYGHYILLGEDAKAVKYLGIDQSYVFKPMVLDSQTGYNAHDVGEYSARIGTLLDNDPIQTSGFSDGAFCDRSYHELCASGRCSVDNTCGMHGETCVADSCKNDLDCISGKCVSNACADEDGMAKGGCPCKRDVHCASGNCVASVTGFDWVCELSPEETVNTRSGARGVINGIFVSFVGLLLVKFLLD